MALWLCRAQRLYSAEWVEHRCAKHTSHFTLSRVPTLHRYSGTYILFGELSRDLDTKTETAHHLGEWVDIVEPSALNAPGEQVAGSTNVNRKISSTGPTAVFYFCDEAKLLIHILHVPVLHLFYSIP